MADPTTALRLTDVVKTFPGVVALDGVSLDVVEGEVHALVGENGAGKSTLMAVAAGATAPDAGTVEIGGRLLETASPAAAQALGLAIVYQHASALDDLTVEENLIFAMPPGRRPRPGRSRTWAADRLAAVGATIDPAARPSELSAADRQLLEIAKALALEPRVLILDEPTESLTVAERERLFERIASIKSAGAAVVYISHRLPEVRRVADRLTVLRDGSVRGTFAVDAVSATEIVRLIVGRSISQVFPAKRAPDAVATPPLLEVRGLSGARFHDVDLTVAPGEIVGLAGVDGNGQREFLRALAGLGSAAGEILLAGEPVVTGDPRRILARRIVHLPGDRHREGLFQSLSVRENLTILALHAAARFGIVQRDHEQRMTARQIAALGIRMSSPEASVATLSGGNQQKVLVGRALLAEPLILLADGPTIGVDVGARVELYRILREAAAAGRGVIVLSSDALELQGLCDRVVVFSRGTIVRTLAADAVTEAAITGAALEATGERRVVTDQARRLLRLRRFVAGDTAPSVVLAGLIVLLAAYTNASNDAFLSERSVQGLLLLASALIFVSLGQLIVILVGGIDLSVGVLAGFIVIVLSTFATESAGAPAIAVGFAAAVLAGVGVGLANGLLARKARLAPVLATLVTFTIIDGLSLLLRPSPSGVIADPVTDTIAFRVGPIPIAFVVAVLLTIGLEWALRRSRLGLELRAVGSDESRAHRLGARVTRTHLVAYVACSVLVALGGLVLASRVGIGQANLGGTYALASITAVVLGGASIFGGRGSFLGAFLGALLLQVIISSTSFLDFGRAWQSWLPGALILLAAGLYSRARGIRAASLGAEPS